MDASRRSPYMFVLMKRIALNSFIMSGFLTLFSIGYSSVLSNDYGFLDDYVDLLPENRDWAIQRKILEGRPLHALFTKLGLSMIVNIEDLHYVRFVGIVCTSLFAFVMFRALVRTGEKSFPSFCVSIILGTTLPFQLYAAWATDSTFPLAGALSGYALLIANQTFESSSRAAKWLSASMAILVLLMALMLYQPAAMIFWVFAAVLLFRPGMSLNDTCTRFLWYGLIGLIAMLLGFAVYNLALVFYPGASNRTGLAADLVEKALFFYRNFPRVLNFALLVPQRSFHTWQWQNESALYTRAFDDSIIVWFTLPFIILGLVVYFRGERIERLLKCFIALALLIFCFTPLLAVEKATSGYRTLAAPASLIVLYLYWSFRGWVSLCHPSRCSWFPLANVILGIAAGASLLLADYHVRNWIVVPQVKELEIMRYPLVHENLADAARIYVIHPAHCRSETFAPFIWKEFGMPSSCLSPPLPVKIRASAMVSCFLRRMAQDYEHLPVISVPAEGPVDPLTDGLVVDMRNFGTRLRLYRWIRSEIPLGTPVIRDSFDVYLDEDAFYYVKAPCAPEDVKERFILTVEPSERDDLSADRKPHGFDNFNFDWHGVIYDQRCMAMVRRPDYPIARIRAGQITIPEMNVLWDATWTVSHDNS